MPPEFLRRLEVKKGKAHGAYREYFHNGLVRKVIFYRSGKTTGDRAQRTMQAEIVEARH